MARPPGSSNRMSKIYKNKKLLKFFPVMFTLACLGVAGISLAKENSGAYIQNNMSSAANTGGNHISGSGTIKTGDAKASANVKNNISGENVEIKVEARAEANGEKVEVNTESDGQNIDIRKEASDENTSASVDVNVKNNSVNIETKEEDSDEAEKGIIASVKEITESFIDKIISLFS